MKAVMFDGVGSVKLGDVPKPDLQNSKDALIRVTHTSICGSDLHILTGRVPVEENFIIGHEAVGVVEKIGSDVKRVKPGDRVVVSVTIQCGECINCRRCQVALCKNGGIFGHGKRWGSFPGTQAEYLRTPYADMVLEPIPADMTEEQAMFVGDILSTGYMACENGSIRPGDVVVVFGAGPVGLCAVAAARLFGPSLIVSVDLLDYRLEAAKRLGADMVINSGQTDPVKEIRRITGGEGAEVTIEAIGSPEALNNCLASVRGAGSVSIVGVFPFAKVEVSIREILRQRLRITAGLANIVNMGRLLSLIRGGKLDLTPLITHRMPLSKAEDAYRLFSTRSENVLKIILRP